MVDADAVRQRCSVVSDRKSVEMVGAEELRRENGLRLRVRVGIWGRRRPRSRLERMMLSKRVMEAWVGEMVEDEVAVGTGAVCSRSPINSLKAARSQSARTLKRSVSGISIP